MKSAFTCCLAIYFGMLKNWSFLQLEKKQQANSYSSRMKSRLVSIYLYRSIWTKGTSNDGLVARQFVTALFITGIQKTLILPHVIFFYGRIVKITFFRPPLPANIEKLKSQVIAAVETVTFKMPL